MEDVTINYSDGTSVVTDTPSAIVIRYLKLIGGSIVNYSDLVLDILDLNMDDLQNEIEANKDADDALLAETEGHLYWCQEHIDYIYRRYAEAFIDRKYERLQAIEYQYFILLKNRPQRQWPMYTGPCFTEYKMGFRLGELIRKAHIICGREEGHVLSDWAFTTEWKLSPENQEYMKKHFADLDKLEAYLIEKGDITKTRLMEWWHNHQK